MKRSILETIGTPLVKVNSPPGSVIAAKLESFNPGRSAKDRPALAMIDAAEEAGQLKPGGHIVEPTSGNTGIGLAIVCAVRGYDLTLVMPASKSAERRRLLRAYGAEIELVEGEMQDAIDRSSELVDRLDAVRLDQFRNPANVDAHYQTTAVELLDDLDGQPVDAFVATVGTGGTLTGVGRRLKERYPSLEIVAVEPTENPVLSTGEPGHDDFQGMGPGFVSEILDVNLIDTIETVTLPEAEAECRHLAQSAGILCGQSSGAAMIASRRVAKRLARNPNANRHSETLHSESEFSASDEDIPLIVTIFPDSGERYLSTGTFDDPDISQ